MIEQQDIIYLKGQLKNYVNQITKPDTRAGKNMYICPLCKSGASGEKGSDGAFSITPDGKKWKCFSCEAGGDIFELIGLYENIDNFIEQAERAASIAGRSLDIQRGQFYEDIKEWNKAARETDYFKKRGFDSDIIKRYNLGYDRTERKIIIPYDKSGNYYIKRAIDKKEFRKPKTDTAGSEPLYNASALYSDKPCFICEAPFDAISIIEASEGQANAVALGGTGTIKLIEAIKNKEPKALLILSLDNDEAGINSTSKLQEDLKGVRYGLAAYTLEEYPEGAKKDASDLFIGNKEQLKKDIEASIKEAKTGKFKKYSSTTILNNLLAKIEGGESGRFIPTGYKRLDERLDGGLYPGLYVMGALSSLGKTTLALQMADSIAKAGKDVFFYSLEMAAEEITAKSLSRLTFKHCGQVTPDAKTVRDIQVSARHREYTARQRDIFSEAVAEYSSYSSKLFIYEGMGNITIEQITNDIKNFKEATGRAPVIFLDYLQIIGKPDDNISDVQKVDDAILGLKQISRDYDTPVFAISSFNRESYMQEVSMTSFKGSSSIEYSSDVLIGLQPQGIKPATKNSEYWENYVLNNKTRANPGYRNLELVILKNRNGKSGAPICFTHHAAFNCFTENKSDKNMNKYNEEQRIL